MFHWQYFHSAVLALAFVPTPTASLPPCPPETQETLVYVDSFGPELADWPEGTLAIPKFVREASTKLVQVEVELCMQMQGTVVFENSDDMPCTFTYELLGTASAAPADPRSPILPFDLTASAQGGPMSLGAGESSKDGFDSGIQCADAQTFTDYEDLAAFTASRGDEFVVLDHAGTTTSSSNGCGALFLDTEIYSTVSLRVTYTYCVHPTQEDAPELATAQSGD